MAKRNLDDIDRGLIALLRANARMTTAAMGRQLGLSRSAVQERLKRLERDKVVAGYTVELGNAGDQPGVAAHVLLTIDPKLHDRALAALKHIPEIASCHTTSGIHDAIAMVRANNAVHLDDVLTRIGGTLGINRTQSAVLLATVFERR
jgi:DNA-binding Lrp family transcriptional regulator